MSRLVNEAGEPIYDDALLDEDVFEQTQSEIADFFEKYPHEVSEVICVKCRKRWISVRPKGTLLKDIECPKCGRGYVIKTGEMMEWT